MSESINKFSGLEKLYSQARPSYPLELIAKIIETCKLQAGSVLADIGAGTGISSRLFAEQDIKVLALEPNEFMRNEGMENSKNFNIEFIDASAEHTTLDSDSLDAILCAQSFHWFHPKQALDEFVRVLKLRGWLILIYNERDERIKKSFASDYGNLLRTLPDTERVESKRVKAGEIIFKDSRFNEQISFSSPNEQILDWNNLVARAFSASYVPKLETELGKEFQNKLKELFIEHNENGNIKFDYLSTAYLVQKL